MMSERTKSLVEAVKSYARDHYTHGGWDYIVECWDDREIATAIVGCKTKQEAIAAVKKTADLLGGVRDDIRNS